MVILTVTEKQPWDFAISQLQERLRVFLVPETCHLHENIVSLVAAYTLKYTALTAQTLAYLHSCFIS